jgi:hypothetical protein
MPEFIPIRRLRQAARFSFSSSQPAYRSISIMLFPPDAGSDVLRERLSMSDDWALKMLVPFGSLAA